MSLAGGQGWTKSSLLRVFGFYRPRLRPSWKEDLEAPGESLVKERIFVISYWSVHLDTHKLPWRCNLSSLIEFAGRQLAFEYALFSFSLEHPWIILHLKEACSSFRQLSNLPSFVKPSCIYFHPLLPEKILLLSSLPFSFLPSLLLSLPIHLSSPLSSLPLSLIQA